MRSSTTKRTVYRVMDYERFRFIGPPFDDAWDAWDEKERYAAAHPEQTVLIAKVPEELDEPTIRRSKTSSRR